MLRFFLVILWLLAGGSAALAQQNCPATPAAGTNNTTCANTAFVQQQFGSKNYVVGPNSSTDGDIALFSGTSGALIKDGGALTFPFKGQPGIVTVYYSTSLAQWVYQKEDGTVISAASNTCQLQEALNYAYPKGLQVIAYGQGTNIECVIQPATANLNVPLGVYVGITFFNFYIDCQDSGANICINFDTQFFSNWEMFNSFIDTCTNNGVGVAFQPSSLAFGTDRNSIGGIYKFGRVRTVAAHGACGTSGTSSVTMFWSMGTCGASQLLTSAWVNNSFEAIIFGGDIAQYTLQLATPCSTNGLVAENQFNLITVQDASLAEIKIGGSSSNDTALATNYWYGNVAHTSSNSNTFAIATDGGNDQFNLVAVNCYNASSGQSNVNWGPNATGNIIQTKQFIGCNVIESGTTQTFAMNNWISGIWRAFTPTLSCSSGTLSSSSATGRAIRPNPYGKTVNFEISATLTTIGTCSGFVQATLPAAANQTQTAVGREDNVSGLGLIGKIVGGTSNIQINKYDNTCVNGTNPCVSGAVFDVTGLYESQ